MILFPNCKINIGLNILRRRPDGYHDIETIMVPVNWCDILEIVPGTSNADTLTVTGRTVDCAPCDNLVMKAVRALRMVKDFPPVDIFLRKVIPDGAGLGGGSSDAAFTLKGINDLMTLGLSDDELSRIAASIGADCSFFIYNRPMLATGTGTELTPFDLNLDRYTIAIVKPGVGVPTGLAYSKVVPEIPTRSLMDDVKITPKYWEGKVKNDFEKSVFTSFPEIGEIKRKLSNFPGTVYTSMSGSGSAVFAISESDILAETLAEVFDGCDIFVSHGRE